MRKTLRLSDEWNCNVSFVWKRTETNTGVMSLKDWLLQCMLPSDEWIQYADTCERMRDSDDEKLQKDLKSGLPCVAVAAELNSRKGGLSMDEKVKHLTGWTQIDIDAQNNTHWDNAEQLKQKVSEIEYVAFAGLSCRGNGVWALVKVSDPQRLKDHFEQLVIDFASIDVFLDTSKGGKPTDLRYYSYDAGAYMADTFTLYDRLHIPKPVVKQRWYSSPTMTQEMVFKGAMTFAENRAGTFSDGNKHTFITYLCIYLNKKGIPQNDAEVFINANLIPLSEIKSNCIEHPYKTYKSQFGVWGG